MFLISLIFKVLIFDLFFGNRKIVETKVLDKIGEIFLFNKPYMIILYFHLSDIVK